MYDEESPQKAKSLKNDSPYLSKQMSKNCLTIEEINQLLIKNLNRGYYLGHDECSGQTNLSDVDHKLFESYKVNEINFDPSIHSKCEHKSNVYARESEISNISKELIGHFQKSLPKSLFQRIFNIDNKNSSTIQIENNNNNNNNELSNKEAYFYEEIYIEKFNIHLLDLIPKPMLSEPAKKFFLKHEINEENVELFYKTFGHIIPRNVYFGGKIYRIKKISEKHYNSSKEEANNKKGDFNFLIKEAQNDTKFQEQNSSCEWLSFGGDMNLRYDKSAWEESLEDPTKWEKIKIEYKYTIDLIIEYFEEDESFTKIKNNLENFIGQKEYYSPLVKEKKQDSQFIDEKNENFLNKTHLAHLTLDVKINNNEYNKHGITFLVNSSPFSSWYVCIVAENSECPSIFGKRKSQIKIEYIDDKNSENFYIILETNNNEKCYLYEKDDFSYFVGIGSCKLFFGYQNKAQVWKIKHYKDNLFTIQSKNNEFLQVGELGQLQKIYRIVKLGAFDPENSLWEIKNN